MKKSLSTDGPGGACSYRFQPGQLLFQGLVGWLLFWGWPGIALGEGVVRDSIGPISSGRGGTNLAFSDNLSLINDNPSGLASIQGLRFDLDLDLLKTDIEYEDPQNDTSAKESIWPLPSAMVSWQFTEKPRPITVGLGFFLPAGFGAEYKLNHPVYGRQKYLSQAALYKLMPTVSVDLGWGLSIGGGFGLAYERAEFEAPFTFNSLGGIPGLVDLKADAFGYAWNIGLQYKITERWTVGVAYISETRMHLEGDLDLDISGLNLPIPDSTARYDVELENTWPRSVGVGTTYRFDRGTVSLDFLWFNWSKAYDSLNLKLSDGDNPVFDSLAGTTTPSDRLVLDWDDSFTVRLGGEFMITPNDTVRAGYIYMTNPVPNRTLTPLIPSILEHSVSVGYGHDFGFLGVDFAYQFSFGSRQKVNASRVSNDFDQSSIQTMAHWFIIGANLTF